MINSSGPNWQIEHSCPQCGAPVVLEETDRLFRCPFCRVRLFIWPDDLFRYFLAPGAPASEPIIFVPYWRLKGIVFSFDGDEISSRIIDSSHLAMNSTPLPLSLGLRTQVLKLRYVTPETPGTFISPDFPFRALAASDFIPTVEEACRKVGQVFQLAAACPDTTDPTSFRYFIGDVASLIFSPVFLRKNLLFDAVLQRPLGAVSEHFRERVPAEERRGTGAGKAVPGTGRPESLPHASDSSAPVSFLATLCPNCGWDLDAERDSLVLFCRNCNRAWQASGGALSEVDFSFLPLSGDPAVCLPFWRIRADISGLELRSHGDLLRLANLTGLAPGARPDAELHFWIPAFKSQPHLFLRLARSLTILGREPDPGVGPPKSPLFPVTLPVGEALESVRVLIASMAAPKRLILPRIKDIELSHKAGMLVYLPFALRGEEFIQPQLQISIQKNALRWGRLI